MSAERIGQAVALRIERSGRLTELAVIPRKLED
jgi:hypothetical protein